MTSRLDRDLVRHFTRLPKHVQKLANENYLLWRADPFHPSLEFKRVNRKLPIWSVRVGIHHRAVAIKPNEESIVWFFIGSHAEYDKLLQRV